jgi:hypothetical protein
MILCHPDHAAVMFDAIEGLCEQSPRADDPARTLAQHAWPGLGCVDGAWQAWDYAQSGGSGAASAPKTGHGA